MSSPEWGPGVNGVFSLIWCFQIKYRRVSQSLLFFLVACRGRCLASVASSRVWFCVVLVVDLELPHLSLFFPPRFLPFWS